MSAEPVATTTAAAAGPRFSQEAYAILSQILEFWEVNYLAGGGSSSSSSKETSKGKEIVSDMAAADQEEGAPEKEKEKEKKVLYIGKAIKAQGKPNGAWNFHTIMRNLTADTAKFETIFCRPSIMTPVPRAKAIVWFTITKKEEIFNVEYRFEHFYQDHTFTLPHSCVFDGLPSGSDLERQSSLLANPAKRLMEIINLKIHCAQQVEASGVLDMDHKARISPFLPIHTVAAPELVQ